MTDVDPVALLQAATGRPHRFVRPLPGGETGGAIVADEVGTLHVLKCESDPGRAAQRRVGVELAERLRTEAGWPVPTQQVLDAGPHLLVLQEFLPGTDVERVDDALVDELLALHGRRLGLARPTDAATWADDLVQTLVEGGRGYCLHEPLRSFDPRSRRLLDRIESIGRSTSASDLDGADVVHGDLHPGNLLQVDGALRAVVDLDYARIGDAAFDLVTLAMTSLTVPCAEGVRHHLFGAIDDLEEVRRTAYVAHLLLRFLDWPIRKGRASDVEFWLGQAPRLLPG